jgi:hypothetical protein
MSCYRFRFFDSHYRLVAGRFAHFADDSLTRANADELLAENGYGSVEVLDADRPVHHAERQRLPDPRSRPIAFGERS